MGSENSDRNHIICDKCKGEGGVQCWDCPECNGHGYVLRREQDIARETDLQFGVVLIGSDRAESVPSKRWKAWSEAASFGATEVKEKRACGFRITSFAVTEVFP